MLNFAIANQKDSRDPSPGEAKLKPSAQVSSVPAFRTWTSPHFPAGFLKVPENKRPVQTTQSEVILSIVPKNKGQGHVLWNLPPAKKRQINVLAFVREPHCFWIPAGDKNWGVENWKWIFQVHDRGLVSTSRGVPPAWSVGLCAQGQV